jgi:CubicO group peptidase (beta-lactamase class C family)
MKKSLIWIAIMILLLATGYFMLPDYTRRALIYWYAGIEDYRIFPNDTIAASDPVAWIIADSADRPTLDRALMDTMLTFDPRAFLVIRNDTMIYEQYFNGHTATSISNVFSVTKSIISLLLGCAIQDGYVGGVEDYVHKYIPEFRTKQYGETLTLQHLLRMSSGIDYDEAYASPFSPTTESYYGRDIEQQMLGLGFMEKPGMRFNYIGANTQLLGMVIQRATGKSLSLYATEKLWGPLQSENDALWSKDRKDGMEKAFCCFTPTARDLARLGQLLCDSGSWNGQELISRDYYHQMTRPASGIIHKGKPVDFYGYHCWLTVWEGHKAIYARGILGQYVIAVPEKQLVIVRLGEKRSSVYIGEHPSDLFLYLEAGFRLAGL